jgi:hypothetical protein
MNNLKPNDQRARVAIILIWLVLLMDVIAFTSGYFQYDLLVGVANGNELSMETANANDLRQRIVGIFEIVIFIISGITFIRWFRRAYYNLKLKWDYLAETDGWVVGAWFVPIVSLYKPYRMMKELYLETHSVLTNKGFDLSSRFTTAHLPWWWALWIINSIMGQILFRFSLRAESLNELISLTYFNMCVNVIGVPLAIITVKVIKDYAKLEPLLLEIKEEEESVEIAEVPAV